MLRSSHRRLTFPTAALLISILGYGTVRAQEPPQPMTPLVIEDLASRVSVEIEKNARASRKPWTIMVVGFPEHGQQEGDFGETLANNFAVALSEHSGVVKLLDRVCLRQSYASESITPVIYADINYQDWRSGRCGATHRIDGFTEIREDQVQLTVSLVDQANERQLFKADVSWPIEPRLKTLLVQPVFFSESDVTAPKIFSTTVTKVRPPSCKYCSKGPEYTGPARKNHYSGSVDLRATVNAQGRVEDLFVVRAAAYGMTEKAIEAVQTWTFTPAMDDNGKPVATRVPIQVTFHLLP